MPTREAELYKDKIEVSLDGRQIFYLFFGGAVIVGLVFVLGVMVGRRVEARGHLDHARTAAAVDPLAALDRLESTGAMSFQSSLTGNGGATTDVERKIAELDKARGKAPAASDKADKPAADDAKPEAKPDAKAPAKAEIKPEPEAKKADKADVKPDAAKKADGDKPADKSEKSDKPEKSEKSEKTDKTAKADKPEASDKSDKPEKADKAKSDDGDKKKAKDGEVAAADEAPKPKFTLQLSSFQDKQEAEAFLSSLKASGYQAYVTEANVSGKGTFYRVRLGTYRSMEAANDAKADFEKASKKSASIMRL